MSAVTATAIVLACALSGMAVTTLALKNTPFKSLVHDRSTVRNPRILLLWIAVLLATIVPFVVILNSGSLNIMRTLRTLIGLDGISFILISLLIYKKEDKMARNLSLMLLALALGMIFTVMFAFPPQRH
jgi:archaellum biogenesis protein FlaJ (TadC family)